MKPVKAGISCRFASRDEAAVVAKLAEETFRESWTESGNENDVDQYVSENFTEEHISRELSAGDISYLLALEDDRPVAYVKLERNLQPDDHKLEKPISVSRVYVRKSFQGKGIGSELLKQSVELAMKEGFKTVWLGVWNENHQAMRLYERFGFVRFGMYQFIMGTAVSDDYLMMRKL